jgi:hypothetical protein
MYELLIERLKHLPGRHDQSTHGRPGRVGTAFRGAYSAARAEGKTHVEARNQAKTAAEQVRQTIRNERRAEREANPKPKRIAPSRAETPTTPPQPPIDASTAEKHNKRLIIAQNNLVKAQSDLAFAQAQLQKAQAQYGNDTSEKGVYYLKKAQGDVGMAQERVDRTKQVIASSTATPPEGRAYTTADPEIRAFAESRGIPDHAGLVFTDNWKSEIIQLAAHGLRKPTPEGQRDMDKRIAELRKTQEETRRAEIPKTVAQSSHPMRELAKAGNWKEWEKNGAQRMYMPAPYGSQKSLYYDVAAKKFVASGYKKSEVHALLKQIAPSSPEVHTLIENASIELR